MAKQYKYIIVGAGLFGATVAERIASELKEPVLVLERRGHVAGNSYSYKDETTGIEVHQYGSHIFHTNDEEVWQYVNRFTEFNGYIHRVLTRHHGELYPMPINLDTINLLYHQNFTGEEAKTFVAEEAEKTGITNPQNFEEKGLSLVGEKLYDAFIKHYTKKQWSVSPTQLSAEILSRIPVRFDHDDRYFTDKYQGIPVDGYGKLAENILNHSLIEVKLNTDANQLLSDYPDATIIYCGQVDELMDYQLGTLPYRSLRFETETTTDTLGHSVINEADASVPYTRAHDYKYYQVHQPEIINQPQCIICKEYPADFQRGSEAYYPVNNDESEKLYQSYVKLAQEKYPHLILGGRLGAYRYWNMDVAIKSALDLAKDLIANGQK